MDSTRRGKRKQRGGRQDKRPNPGRTLSAREVLLPRKREVHHLNAPVPEPQTVGEPHPVCPLCGKPVDLIAESITDPQGGHCHFDCVLEQIKQQEHPAENQKISYLGSGCFGVCEKDAEGKWTIVKRIPYESPETFNAAKKYVKGLKQ